jgi:hypothetical protein
VIRGFIQSAFVNYAIDQDDAAAGFEQLSRKVYDRYMASIKGSERVGLPPYKEDIWKSVLEDVTNPESGFIPEMRAVLLTKLQQPDPWIGRTSTPRRSSRIDPAPTTNRPPPFR